MKKILLTFLLLITTFPFNGKGIITKYKIEASDDSKKQIVKNIIDAYEKNNANSVTSLNENQDLGDIKITKQTQQQSKYAKHKEPFITISNATPLAIALELFQLWKKNNQIVAKLIKNTTDLFKEYTSKVLDINIENKSTPIKTITESKHLLEWFVDEITDNLQYNNKIDAYINDNQDTLLHILCSDDMYNQHVNMFIQNGANIEVTNKDGKFPLYIATRHPAKTEILMVLAKEYENVKYDLTKIFAVQDNNNPQKNHSPFSLLWDSHDETIQWFAIGNILENKQENNSLDFYNNTLLHYFVDTSNVSVNNDEFDEIIKGTFTTKNNPITFNLEVKNTFGQTPLDLAFHNINLAWIKILLEKGAKLNNIDEKATKIVQHVIDNSYTKKWGQAKDILTLLIEYGANKDLRIKQIKDSHTYKNHGKEVKKNLDEIITLIEKTQQKPISVTPPSSQNPEKKKKDPLTKKLTDLSKQLVMLKEKLKNLATQLENLSTNLGVKKP